MKRIVFLISLCSLVTFAYAQEGGGFVYDDHGKKDPFAAIVSPSGAILSYDEEAQAVDLHLEGILADKQGKNLAIINGKIVKPNDSIGTYSVEGIFNDRVELIRGGERLTLKVKKGGS